MNAPSSRRLVLTAVLFCVGVQLVANAVLFTSVNLSGVFVRILTERTQRKVFLQARNCIEERLRLEDENEKQVSVRAHFSSLMSLFLSFKVWGVSQPSGNYDSSYLRKER